MISEVKKKIHIIQEMSSNIKQLKHIYLKCVLLKVKKIKFLLIKLWIVGTHDFKETFFLSLKFSKMTV